MITRARVIYQEEGDDYHWYVHIPILDGLPDSSELQAYRSDLNSKINSEISKSGESLSDIEKQAIKVEAAKVTLKSWQEKAGVDSNNLDLNRDSEIEEYNEVHYEYLHKASICSIPGLSNSITEGDIVYVAFEDNDMGKPVIIGHLLTASLEDARSNYPAAKLSNVQVQIPTNSKEIFDNNTFINILNQIEKIKQDITYSYNFLSKLEAVVDTLPKSGT